MAKAASQFVSPFPTSENASPKQRSHPPFSAVVRCSHPYSPLATEGPLPKQQGGTVLVSTFNLSNRGTASRKKPHPPHHYTLRCGTVRSWVLTRKECRSRSDIRIHTCCRLETVQYLVQTNSETSLVGTSTRLVRLVRLLAVLDMLPCWFVNSGDDL
jgi:hypothetical protein